MANTMMRRDPFEDMFTMKPFFERFWRNEETTRPTDWVDNLAVDIYDQDGSLIVKAPVPGMKPDDVHITVNDDVLTIDAETREDKEVKKEDYYVKEYHAGRYSRSIRLPPNLKMNEAKATFENGMLYLTIPRTKPTTPKAVHIPVVAKA